MTETETVEALIYIMLLLSAIGKILVLHNLSNMSVVVAINYSSSFVRYSASATSSTCRVFLPYIHT
jgi:hypothetical protein